MPPSHIQKDLLGKPIRKRRPRYEVMLERHELRNVPVRAERIRWLSTVIPRNSVYMMPLESIKVFQEAKDCFVYGQFVGTVVLSAAFVEHWLGGILTGYGAPRIAAQGLAEITQYCRENDALPSILCDKVDVLRKIRNPFVHLKPFDHPHGLGQRMRRQRTHPDAILEADAKEAIITMYSVATYTKTKN
jgi:hypothetical protein